jgi:sulfite exporter TauE/SafE
MTTLLAAGALLGLAGSLHCAAMCGPLAIWAHGRPSPGARGATAALGYHAGRLSTYAVLGVVLGATGGVAVSSGWGRALAIGLAAWLVVQAASAAGLLRRVSRVMTAPAPVRWVRDRARSVSSRVLRGAMSRRNGAAAAAAGLVTGLMPCGLLHAALAGAAAAAGPLDGAAFMMAFGLATTPALAGVVWAGTRLGPRRALRAGRAAAARHCRPGAGGDDALERRQ